MKKFIVILAMFLVTSCDSDAPGRRNEEPPYVHPQQTMKKDISVGGYGFTPVYFCDDGITWKMYKSGNATWGSWVPDENGRPRKCQ